MMKCQDLVNFGKGQKIVPLWDVQAYGIGCSGWPVVTGYSLETHIGRHLAFFTALWLEHKADYYQCRYTAEMHLMND